MRKARYVAGPKAIGGLVGKSTRATLAKRGFAHAEILTSWPEIVGPTLANVSSPERLSFTRQEKRDATLKVRVAPGHAPEFQHYERLIIERINSFFGFRAVGRLAILQAPIKRQKLKENPQKTAISEDQKNRLEAILSDIEDDELRQKLYAIGTSLTRKKASRETDQST